MPDDPIRCGKDQRSQRKRGEEREVREGTCREHALVMQRWRMDLLVVVIHSLGDNGRGVPHLLMLMRPVHRRMEQRRTGREEVRGECKAPKQGASRAPSMRGHTHARK